MLISMSIKRQLHPDCSCFNPRAVTFVVPALEKVENSFISRYTSEENDDVKNHMLFVWTSLSVMTHIVSIQHIHSQTYQPDWLNMRLCLTHSFVHYTTQYPFPIQPLHSHSFEEQPNIFYFLLWFPIRISSVWVCCWFSQGVDSDFILSNKISILPAACAYSWRFERILLVPHRTCENYVAAEIFNAKILRSL